MSALNTPALYVLTDNCMLCQLSYESKQEKGVQFSPEGQTGTHRESRGPLSRGSAEWEGGQQFLLPSISSGHRILVILF